MSPEHVGQSIDVLGSKIHFYEEGKGEPVVFIHGMPTSSYLWRKITPVLGQHARCIALDLIGMGQSDRPSIPYRVFDHIHYFDGFMKAMQLDQVPVTLVMHDWGSVIGFDYARRHEQSIKSLVFYEPHVRAAKSYDMLSLPIQQLASLLWREKASYKAIVEQDYFIDRLLPSGSVDPLPRDVLEHYRSAFPDAKSRQVLWQYVHDLPLGKGPEDVVHLIDEYSAWLQKTTIPKLFLYAVPGLMTTIDTVVWARNHFPALTLTDLGTAMHFAPETIPEQFSGALLEWCKDS